MSIARIKSAVATLLSAAVILAAPGLAPYSAMAQVVGRAAPVATPVVPGAAVIAPVSAPAFSLAASPVLPAGLSPSLSLPTPALPSPVAAAQAVTAAPTLTLPSPTGGRGVSAAIEARTPAAVANPLAKSHPSSLPLPRAGEGGVRAEGAFSSLRSVGGEISKTRPGAAPMLDAASAGLFDGSRARAGLANGVSEPVEAKPSGAKRRGVGLALKRATAVGALVVGLRMAAPNIPGLPADPSFWTKALDVVGRGGYWLGNLMAFAFAVPQIYKTFRDGSAGKTPVWRAVVGASASLALGLVSAPLAKQMFWGVQNIFGGLALAAPILIGAYLARKGLKFSARKAAGLTAATAALLFAPAFAMYAAAEELVPAAINAAAGAAAVGPIALALQIATGAAFFLLFVPDIVAIVKGRAPRGFTAMFSMLFALASIGFIAWTLQMAAAAPAGSSERVQFLIYAAQNAAYAVVSLLSWFFIRRAERKARPSSSVTPSETR
ncbi:MAG: Uncharacterized protein FD126_1297 [Elusimicrobia bacterium]|nr:MAG: Uncharacterized protein FD126_1297 [Elusimicrobiota bacterium]